ncbi:MAG: hypothetical protein JW772_00250 [Candidatus Diapherotrites archaeon]|nr:hypothetical protein [Candidatus Diapherotrites archaeon]
MKKTLIAGIILIFSLFLASSAYAGGAAICRHATEFDPNDLNAPMNIICYGDQYSTSGPVGVASACTLTPNPLDLDFGATDTITVECTDAGGAPIACPQMTWTLKDSTPTDIGDCTTGAGDAFVSCSAGTGNTEINVSGLAETTNYTMEASETAGAAFSCTSSINVAAAPIGWSCTIVPNSFSIPEGASQTLTTICYDTGVEQPCPNAGSTSWQVNNSGGNPVAPAGDGFISYSANNVTMVMNALAQTGNPYTITSTTNDDAGNPMTCGAGATLTGIMPPAGAGDVWRIENISWPAGTEIGDLGVNFTVTVRNLTANDLTPQSIDFEITNAEDGTNVDPLVFPMTQTGNVPANDAIDFVFSVDLAEPPYQEKNYTLRAEVVPTPAQNETNTANNAMTKMLTLSTVRTASVPELPVYLVPLILLAVLFAIRRKQ